MYAGKRILGLIPARGGSKGIPDKNIKSLDGRPLISYTIEAAKNSQYVDAVVITTDSQKIADVAIQYGAEVPFLRPGKLASDKAKSIDAVVHAIETLKSMGRSYDVLVFLQPTSPLRNAEDIDRAIEQYFNMGNKALVSVSPVNDHPLLIRSIDQKGELDKLMNVSSTCRRQDMPVYYRVNGAIYIYNVTEITSDTSLNDAMVPYIMDISHSVDIDDLCDFYIAEFILQNKNAE